MEKSNQSLFQLFQLGLIEPYEDELIVRLRDKYYEGLPISVILNSRYCCNSWCHHMALQLTRGMDYFRIVRGNVNCYQVDGTCNHSWIEKDGWVYDTTFGFKWKRDIYYDRFDAAPIEIYDENNYLENEFYRDEFKKCEDYINSDICVLLDVIEEMATVKPSVNDVRLMEEIRLFKEKKNLEDKFIRC